MVPVYLILVPVTKSHRKILITKEKDNTMKRIIKELSAFADQTEKGHDVSIAVFYDSEYKEYQVESWNPRTWNEKPRGNIYYTDCKEDALETANFILKRGI
jgi:hypothetical protein